MSPKEIESLITTKIENELDGVNGLDKISSTSFHGMSQIIAEFRGDIDVEQALQRTKERVDLAKPKLPDSAEEPIVKELNFSDQPFLILTVSHPDGLYKLEPYIDDLETGIENIYGIQDVVVSGKIEKELEIALYPSKLKHYGFSIEDVKKAIREEHVSIPGGSYKTTNRHYSLSVSGEMSSVDEFKNIIVNVKGVRAKLQEIASVTFSYKDPDSISRLNGYPAISLSVKKRSGENMLAIVKQIKEFTSQFKKSMPNGTQLTFPFDESGNVRRMVSDLENNILSGLILVLLVTLFFLGPINATFVSLAIPFSMLISFFVLSAFSITLNMVVLFSLVIALGMLVDNGIVIVENIYRHAHLGKSITQAAIDGTKEIALPITTSTLTTILAFFPIIYMPDIMGEFLSYLPKTVIIVLIASLFVGLTITTAFCSRFLKINPNSIDNKNKLELNIDKNHPLLKFHKKQNLPIKNKFSKRKELIKESDNVSINKIKINNISQKISRNNFFDKFLIDPKVQHFLQNSRIISVLKNVFNYVSFDFISQKYESILRLCLKNPVKSILTMVIIVVLGMILNIFFGNETIFFPNLDPPVAFVNTKLPVGTPVELTDTFTSNIESIIKNSKGSIESLQTTIGTGKKQGGSRDSFRSSVRINYKPYLERSISSTDSIEHIRKNLEGIPGADIKVEKMQGGPPKGNDISYKIEGDSYENMGQLAKKIVAILKQYPESLENINTDYEAGKPEISIQINREKARRLELSTREIANALRTSLSGSKEGIYKYKNEEYDINMRYLKSRRNSFRDIIYLELVKNGSKIPLSSVAEISMDQTTTEIKRQDGKRSITVYADFKPDIPNKKDINDKIIKQVNQLDIPAGYSLGQGEGQEVRNRSTAFLMQAFLTAVFMIFLVLVIQFNSVTQPLMILASVFLSLGGVSWGLLITHQKFVIIMSGIGIISLAGVVVNNAIVLIDFINQIKENNKKQSHDESIIQASLTRLRPVLLTALTTVIGLFPMAFGISFDFATLSLQIGSESSEWWAPMAWTIIFGLTFATILTLFIIPCFMKLDSLFEHKENI